LKHLSVPVTISYSCKHCKQLAPRPEITKENWMHDTWHDCTNNVWKKEPREEAKEEAA